MLATATQIAWQSTKLPAPAAPAHAEDTPPAMLLSPSRAAGNYRRLCAEFPGAEVAYRVRANAHPQLLAALAACPDARFAVGSETEIATLAGLGVPGARMHCHQPLANPYHLEYAVDRGVRLFAVADAAGVERLAALNSPAAPLAVFVRVQVEQAGTLPQPGPAGAVAPEKALALLHYAARLGLGAAGLAFHAGSQCLDPGAWEAALRELAPVWRRARAEGLALELVNIGGGFPAAGGAAPLGERIAATLRALCPGCRRLLLEPGRRVAADAAALLLTVAGAAPRLKGGNCLYLDARTLPGLGELHGGLRPAVVPLPAGPRLREMTSYRLVCFTSLSNSALFDICCPVRLMAGDMLLLRGCGAYLDVRGGAEDAGWAAVRVLDSEWRWTADGLAEAVC